MEVKITATAKTLGQGDGDGAEMTVWETPDGEVSGAIIILPDGAHLVESFKDDGVGESFEDAVFHGGSVFGEIQRRFMPMTHGELERAARVAELLKQIDGAEAARVDAMTARGDLLDGIVDVLVGHGDD